MLTARSIRGDELTTEVAVGVGVAAAGEWLLALGGVRLDERVVLAFLAASLVSFYRWLAGGALV
ncbi:MAG TPA: hypothetical protein PLS29_01365 [Acidimicrobiales bacterium]|nr:MAG: hypothetical protein B7Z69_06805 [Actinobacteria bacterium 21-73-9]HQU25659.1 hypothetical protein [Acidimicrobiales bacterium]